MATVSAGNVGSGPAANFFGATWDAAHDEDEGPTGFLSGIWNNANASGNALYGPGASAFLFIGVTKYNIYRLWMDFDLSGESGTALSVDLKVKASSCSHSVTDRNMQTTKIIPVKTTKSAGLVVNTTINDLDGWEAGFDDSDLTALASEQTFPNAADTDEWVTYTLNSDGISAVNDAIGSGNCNIAFLEYDHDYLDNGSITATHYYRVNMVMTGDDQPYLDITYAGGVTSRLKLSGGSFNLKGGNLIIK